MGVQTWVSGARALGTQTGLTVLCKCLREAKPDDLAGATESNQGGRPHSTPPALNKLQVV